MKCRQLKVNINAFKGQIDSDFFRARDVLYRVLVTNLYNSGVLFTDKPPVIVIDESFYNNILIGLCSSMASPKDAINILPDQVGMHVYLDTSLYIEPFIHSHIDPAYVNLYHMGIDADYSLVITHTKVRHASKNNTGNFK
jgi:hypothetical protein